MPWDPVVYERFAAQRARPFVDLLSRLPDDLAPQRVLDAGCGTGRTTRKLAERYPEAEVLGVDASAEMLEGTARTAPSTRFEQGDLTTWEPKVAQDLVVSNAVLHWLGDPATAALRTATWVRPSGWLALQVPDNFDAPSHRAVRDTAANPAWRDRMPQGPAQPLDLGTVRDRLLDDGWLVEAWRTTYHHVLPPGGVLEWLRGTTLRPYLAAAGDDAPAFEAALAERLAAAYPEAGDRVVFPFSRVFLVAQAPA
ncbi:MAG: methyltransferase domain-containing protein [Thermoplasmatota archaeon]